MKKRNLKIKNVDIILLSYIFIMISDMFSNVDFLKPFLSLFSYFGIFIISIEILIQSKNYKKGSFLIILFLLIITGFFTIKNLFTDNYKNIVYILLFIIASKNLDFDYIVKKVFKYRLIFMMCIIICSFLNLTTDFNMLRINSNTIRYSLGFAHPNRLSACIMELVFEYIYIYKNKLSYFKIFNLILISYLVIYVTDSRTVSIMIIITLLFLLLNKFLKGKLIEKSFVNNMIRFLPILMCLLSVYICYLFNNGNTMAYNLNTLLTGRIRLMSNAIKISGITLFGSNVDAVDNSYIQLITRTGIIFSSIFIVLYIKSLKHVINEKNYTLCIIFMLYLFFGLFESYLFRLTYNVFILYFGKMIYCTRKKRE